MRKIISFMHISLDGFVAGPNGEMDWIKADQELFDYIGKRISEGDTALYGRVTYQLMESYWPTVADKPTATKHDIKHSKWYSNVHKVVLSKTMQNVSLSNTNIISDNLTDRINQIKQQEGKEILLFGSPSATHSLNETPRRKQRGILNDCNLYYRSKLRGIKPNLRVRHSFTRRRIKLNLIDGYWLFVNPIILGQGIPLFVDIRDKIKLKLLTTTRQFNCGVTELNYTMDR